MDTPKGNTAEFLDLPKLADDVVLLLSSVQRGSKLSEVDLEMANLLCSRLALLLQNVRASNAGQKEEPLPPDIDSKDYQVLRATVIDSNKEYEKTEEAKNLIKALATGQSSHTAAEIERTEEHLICITMPIWQNRTSEFQRRKMKRSLIVHA